MLPHLIDYTGRCYNQNQFNNALNAIAEWNADAFEWLSDIDEGFWTCIQFPKTSYGHVTNNLSESFNNSIKLERGENVIILLEAIRKTTLVKMSQGLDKAKKMPNVVKKGADDVRA
ncbi:hypothetical protein GEMRC1_001273 [Eukaryota sp. GEM-RC1]